MHLLDRSRDLGRVIPVCSSVPDSRSVSDSTSRPVLRRWEWTEDRDTPLSAGSARGTASSRAGGQGSVVSDLVVGYHAVYVVYVARAASSTPSSSTTAAAAAVGSFGRRVGNEDSPRSCRGSRRCSGTSWRRRSLPRGSTSAQSEGLTEKPFFGFSYPSLIDWGRKRVVGQKHSRHVGLLLISRVSARRTI